MKAIVLKDSTGTIVSNIATNEFNHIFDSLIEIVRYVASASKDIDSSRIFDIDLWSITNNPTVKALWEIAVANYLAKACSIEFKNSIQDAVLRFAAPPTVVSGSSTKAEETINFNDFIAEEISFTEIELNEQSVVDDVIYNNKNDIINQIADMLSNFKPKSDYFKHMTNMKYWLNMEHYINTNWQEIYNRIETIENEDNIPHHYPYLAQIEEDNNKMISIVQEVYKQAGLLL